MPRRSLVGLALLAVALLAIPGAAEACQVCFGDPNSPMTKGAQAGVWVLLGIVVAVEIGFAVFFFVFLRRRLRGRNAGREGVMG